MLTAWISGRGDRDGRTYSSADGRVDEDEELGCPSGLDLPDV